MNNKTLRANSKILFKNAPTNYWIVGLLCGLFTVATISLGLLMGSLGLVIIISFLALPFFFGSIVHCSNFKKSNVLLMGNQVRCSLLYFNRGFRGSFRVGVSFLWSLLVFVITSSILSVVAYAILFALMSQDMNNFISALNSVIEDVNSINELYETVYSYESIINLYSLIAIVPSFLISIIFFMSKISINALSIYYRLETNIKFLPYATQIHNLVISNNKKAIRKEHLYLNWPYFLLLLIGIVIGFVVASIFCEELYTVLIFSIMSGFLLAMLYLPYCFANFEALYQKYKDEYFIQTKNFISSLMFRFKESTILSEEELNQFQQDLGNKEDNNENK